MRYLLYNTAWRATAPLLRRRLQRDPAQASLMERFAPELPCLDVAPVWVHACSVGEVNTALPLLAAVRDVFGERGVLLTASTATGRARAAQAWSGPSSYLPFDHPTSVSAFLDAVQPKALVLIETELWPNLLRECAERGIPVIVANARLSDKHYARYQRWRRLAAPMFAALNAVGAQNVEYASRFAALGTPPERIHVTGNLKFDAAPTEVSLAQRQRVRATCGIPENAPMLVFGSTRPGDEALASACWVTLREEFPTLYLVIVPRHIDRRDEIRSHFGEPVLLRSAVQAGQLPHGERVILVDTLGELTHFYAGASLTVVGGSFYPGVEGHNPLEPAALGVPAVFGPHMANFAEPAEELVKAGAAVQVSCIEDLYDTLSRLLRDAADLRQRGTRGRRAVLDHQGATSKNLALLRACLEQVAPG